MHEIDSALHHRTKLNQERMVKFVCLKHPFPLLKDSVKERGQWECCPLVQTWERLQ